MSRQEMESRLLAEALLGNMAAVDLCQRLFRVSQTLDDLVDGDRRVTPAETRLIFWDALIEIPANPFYRANFDYLHPILAAAYLDWEDATELEQEDDHGRDLAFVLRDSIGQIIIHCALLIGGRDHARHWSLAIRRHICNETLQDYKEGFGK